jgi:hypothetical protein
MTESGHTSNEQKIQILMAEYQSLRAEVLQRNTVLNQTIAAFGTLAVPIIAYVFFKSLLVGLALLAAAPTTVFVTWFIVDRQTRVLARRLRELERSINEKAGEQLLRWETDRKGLYSN